MYRIRGIIHVTFRDGRNYGATIAHYNYDFDYNEQLPMNDNFLKECMTKIRSSFIIEKEKDEYYGKLKDNDLIILSCNFFKNFEDEWIPIL